MSRSRNTQRLRAAKSFVRTSTPRVLYGVKRPLLWGNGCPDCGSGRCDWCESNARRRDIRQAYEPVRALLVDAVTTSQCLCEFCDGVPYDNYHFAPWCECDPWDSPDYDACTNCSVRGCGRMAQTMAEAPPVPAFVLADFI